MLTLESKFSEFIALCEKDGACEDAKAWNAKHLEANKDITMKEIAEAYVKDETIPECWSFWNLSVHGDELCAELKEAYLSKIKEPVTAMRIYLDCEHLSDTEDAILRSKFIVDGKSLLPTATKELADGVVTRSKITAVG